MNNHKHFVVEPPADTVAYFEAITRATSELYVSIHVLDIVNGTAIPIKTNQFIDKFMVECNSLQESVTNIMVNLAATESVESIRAFTILSTLSERMKNVNVVSEIFHGKIHGWCKAIFVRIGDDDPLRRVLYLVENVNEQVSRIEEQKKLLEASRKQQNRINALMNEKVYTDSLSRVMNRKYFDEKLSSQNCLALVIADIDLFKGINDNYGHQCGDEAIAAVASLLQSTVRSMDCVVRYGGDEFLISFKEITPDVLKQRLEQMRDAVEKIQLPNYPDVKLSMSFGGTFGDGIVSDMFSFADKALYESKKKRNCVTLVPFEPN
jgi:diguanylate cyclase (GGDEF)-like protein